MQLNSEGYDELRAKVESLLASVPEGKRVHLDKSLLEKLLFETIVCNKTTGEKVKLPIWSGEFLRKIDLSDISFENVSWSLLTGFEYISEFSAAFDAETWGNFKKQSRYCRTSMVDYSYTNAKIDFSKSWEAKLDLFSIVNCNFSGVDLSNNDMSKVCCIFDSDLSYSGIILLPEMFKSHWSRFRRTSFANVDLSSFTINAKDLVSGLDSCLFDKRCNLANSRINIVIKSSEMTLPDPKPGYSCGDYDPDSLKNAFRGMLNRGYLNGCYANGKRILSLEEKKALARQMLSEYQDYKQEIFNSVSSSIAEQIENMHR